MLPCARLAFGLLPVLCLISACSSDDGPCAELLACCRQIGGPVGAQCEASYQSLVDQDGAEQACSNARTALGPDGCRAPAGLDGGLPGFDAGSPSGPSGSLNLVLVSQVDGGRSVFLRLRNDASINVNTSGEHFSLVLDDGRVLGGDGSGGCRDTIAPGATLSCSVHFYDPNLRNHRGVRIEFVFQNVTGRADVPASNCVGGLESSGASCGDGCDNDLNGFIDCEDRSCCEFVGGCSANSYCGRNPWRYESSDGLCRDGVDNDHDGRIDCEDDECCNHRSDCPTSSFCGAGQCPIGPENTLAACTDGCNNDQDQWIDCEDRDCCPALTASNYSCPVGSFCAR